MHHSLSLPILLLSSAIVQAAVPESLAIPQTYLDSHPHPVHTAPPPAYAVDRILVKFRPGAAASDVGELMRESRAKALKVISGIDVHVLQVPVGTVEAQLARFNQNPNVLYAEPDINHIVQYVPNEGLGGSIYASDYFSEQWALNNTGQVHSTVVNDPLFGPYLDEASGLPGADINAPEAWDMTKGSSAVKIAILDSGIDCRMAGDSVSSIEFGNGKCVEQQTFVTDYQSDKLEDVVGHGTHVAGIAAAQTDNGIGIAGVGFNSSVGNLKTCYEYLIYSCDPFFGCFLIAATGVCPLSSSIDAITYAADNGYHVINMSYGSDEIDEEGNPISLVGYSQAENDAVNYAWGKGVLLVSAAGNAGDPIKNYPAAYDNVIAVGATDDDDNRASFSSFGSDWVSLMAPGDSILSTMPNEQCGTFDYDNDACLHWQSGTSMASPHVAGAAALLWAYKYADQLSDPATCQDASGVPCNQMIRMMLEQGADPIGADGQDLQSISQYGRLNLVGALTATPSEPPPPPPLVVKAPEALSISINNSIVSLTWNYSGDQGAIAGFRVERESWNAKRNRWQSLSSWDVLDPTVMTFEDSSANGEVHYRVGTIQQSDGSLFWSGWSDNITVAGSGGGKGGGKGGRKPNK
ncbi:S8 family serine peptidase [Vibrio parahaemolyticus]|nr:S8 family serine peptidase [Vibrio parahaemolyticus]